jgi:hypothetical protein
LPVRSSPFRPGSRLTLLAGETDLIVPYGREYNRRRYRGTQPRSPLPAMAVDVLVQSDNVRFNALRRSSTGLG